MKAPLLLLLLLASFPLVACTSSNLESNDSSMNAVGEETGQPQASCGATVGPTAEDYAAVFDPIAREIRDSALGELPSLAQDAWPKIDIAANHYESRGEMLLRVEVPLPDSDAPNTFALVDLKHNQFFFVRAFGDSVGLVQGPGNIDLTSAGQAISQLVKTFMTGPAAGGLSSLSQSDWPTGLAAPDGTPLLKVDVELPNADSSVQYALINPERGAFYFVRAWAEGDIGLVQGGCRR